MTIGECAPGDVVNVTGIVRSVMLRPHHDAPALEIEIYDETGSLTCIWLGRRSIGGIEPGRYMSIEGRMTCTEDAPVVFNPRYELRAPQR